MLSIVRQSNCQIFKVPFSFKRVPSSFTSEGLCYGLLEEIRNIKTVKENASEMIEEQLQKS